MRNAESLNALIRSIVPVAGRNIAEAWEDRRCPPILLCNGGSPGVNLQNMVMTEDD